MQWSCDCLESEPSRPLPNMVIAEPVPGGHNKDNTSSILDWAVSIQPELLPVAFGALDQPPRSSPEGCACALHLWRTGALGVREAATGMNGATLSLLHPYPPLSPSPLDSHTLSEDPFLAVILTGILCGQLNSYSVLGFSSLLFLKDPGDIFNPTLQSCSYGLSKSKSLHVQGDFLKGAP